MEVSDDESELCPKNINAEKVICAGCKATAVRKIVLCDICKSTQHKSCYEKYGCCNKKKQNVADVLSLSDTDTLLRENCLLKKTLIELEESINCLKQRNVQLESEKQELLKIVNNNQSHNFVTLDLFNTKFNELVEEINKVKTLHKATNTAQLSSSEATNNKQKFLLKARNRLVRIS